MRELCAKCDRPTSTCNWHMNTHTRTHCVRPSGRYARVAHKSAYISITGFRPVLTTRSRACRRCDNPGFDTCDDSRWCDDARIVQYCVCAAAHSPAWSSSSAHVRHIAHNVSAPVAHVCVCVSVIRFKREHARGRCAKQCARNYMQPILRSQSTGEPGHTPGAPGWAAASLFRLKALAINI